MRFRNLSFTQSQINRFGASSFISKGAAVSSICSGLIQVLNCWEGNSSCKLAAHNFQIDCNKPNSYAAARYVYKKGEQVYLRLDKLSTVNGKNKLIDQNIAIKFQCFTKQKPLGIGVNLNAHPVHKPVNNLWINWGKAKINCDQPIFMDFVDKMLKIICFSEGPSLEFALFSHDRVN